MHSFLSRANLKEPHLIQIRLDSKRHKIKKQDILISLKVLLLLSRDDRT